MNSLDLTLRLGEADRAEEIVIRWPSGVMQRLEDVRVNRVVMVEEAEEWVSIKNCELGGRAPNTLDVGSPSFCAESGLLGAEWQAEAGEVVVLHTLQGSRYTASQLVVAEMQVCQVS